MEARRINFGKVWVIVRKEWAELIKNKLVVSMTLFMPVLFVALPLAVIYFMGHAAPGKSTSNMQGIENSPAFAGMDPVVAVQILLVQQFMFFFLMLPLILPTYIAAYSIIGEKQQRSLEPLLATPITTTELLLGKVLAALIPAVVVTYVAFIVYVILAWFIAPARVFQFIIEPMWLLAIFLLGPLLGVLSVAVGVIISSRVNDVRMAEQIGGLLVLPLILLVLPLTAQMILVSTLYFVAGGLIVLLIDVAVMWLGVKLFQRETILTRWK